MEATEEREETPSKEDEAAVPDREGSEVTWLGPARLATEDPEEMVAKLSSEVKGARAVWEATAASR